MAHGNPLLSKVLEQYPDVDAGSLNWPPDAASWDEKELDLFVGSGGFLKPKKKKAAAAKPSVMAQPTQGTKHSGSSGYAHQDSSSSVKEHASPASSSAMEVETKRESEREKEKEKQKENKKDNENGQKHSTVGGQDGASLADELPSCKPKPIELLHTKVVGGADGHTVVPITTHLEDVGPSGLRIGALLNKFERCRSLLLKNTSGLDLGVIREKHNAGVLLREFACEVESGNPALMMTPMRVLEVHTSVDLPISPFIPFTQKAFGKGQNGKDEIVSTGRFGHLLVDMATMSPSENQSIYEEVAVEVRKVFAIPKPDGSQNVPKFPRLYPKRGRPFRPSRRLQSEHTVSPKDCDMYRVIFHPRMCEICEKINFSVRADFSEMSATGIYANLAKPCHVGDRLDVHLFIQDEVEPSRRVAVLYLFLLQSPEMQAKAPPSASACVMTVLMIYSEPPGRLASEEVGACGAPNFAKLCQIAAGDKNVDTATNKRMASELDFSLLS